jgi:hypothetical protein
MNQDGACLCGGSRFTVAGTPIGRFFCHCTICQKAYGKPFADVTYFWATRSPCQTIAQLNSAATVRRPQRGGGHARNAAIL